ncbi:unnamed protein product, partial [Chrysoparadoxa australica]
LYVRRSHCSAQVNSLGQFRQVHPFSPIDHWAGQSFAELHQLYCLTQKADEERIQGMKDALDDAEKAIRCHLAGAQGAGDVNGKRDGKGESGTGLNAIEAAIQAAEEEAVAAAKQYLKTSAGKIKVQNAVVEAEARLLQGETLASELFDLFEADGNGAVDREELIPLLAQFGIRIAESEALLKEIDTDGSGDISKEEFLKWVSSYKGKRGGRG